MPETKKTSTPIGNRLLAALPKKEFQRLFPDLKQIDLTYGVNIYEIGDQIKHVYFPQSGIVSLLSEVDERTILEVGIVGREGMVGLPVFLGMKTSNNRAVVQGSGVAWKISVKNFQKECDYDGILPRLLKLYTYTLLTQTSHTAVCNLYHSIDARLARWLLMSHDRMIVNEFQLTQEFLSNMLGVRREAVNKAATSLRQQQLISYSRGKIKILDRIKLESASCACYAIIRQEEQNFFRQIPNTI